MSTLLTYDCPWCQQLEGAVCTTDCACPPCVHAVVEPVSTMTSTAALPIVDVMDPHVVAYAGKVFEVVDGRQGAPEGSGLPDPGGLY